MKNKLLLILLAVVLAISVGLVGCAAPAQQEEEEEEETYDLTITSTAGGSVTSPGEDTFTYDEGEVVNLEATPDNGYRLVNWTGDVSTIDNVNAASTTITMNGDYSITANFGEDEVVTFIDPNLEAAVREAISIPEGPIYTQDMEQLGGVSAQQSGISDLTGLEYATHLTQLLLNYNDISDISPLANLSQLRYLYLDGSQIDDISPLADLTNLNWLSLRDNQISNISPLVNLANLTVLYLENNQISDIKPLVDNEGLVSRTDVEAKVTLTGNPLSSDSINIYIPQLEARGVNVSY